MAVATTGRAVAAVARREAVSEEGEDLAAGTRIAGPGHNDPGRRNGGNRNIVHGDVVATIAVAEEATPAEAVTTFCFDSIH